jgi:hypothetical protein|nr:MAG TPA: hypothetical protein [Caudoviricetes sp.]
MAGQKILDYAFREELVSALMDGGFDIDKAQDIVDSRQRMAVKEGALAILKNVIKLFEEEKFEDLSKMLSFSPAGDGYGCNNDYIDFSSLDQTNRSNKLDKDFSDIGTIIRFLDCKNK